MKPRLPRVVWFLSALLLIGAVLLKFGESADQSYIGATGVGASGTAGLANLLRSMGYKVDVNPSSMFDVDKNSVLFKYVPPSTDGWGKGQEQAADVAGDMLDKLASDGGKLVVLRMPPGGPSSVVPVTHPFLNSGAPEQINLDGEVPPNSGALSKGTIPIAQTPGGDLITLTKRGKGMMLDVNNASFLSNSNLAKGANAKVFAEALSQIAEKGQTIVISEATAGHGEAPSIIEALGPAFLSAWRQLLLTCLVIAYALGRRFGLPDRRRVIERGGRELVDAVAGLLKRSRRAQFAGDEEMRRLDARVRREFNIDNRMSAKDRDKVLPKHIAEILNTTEGSVDQSRDAELLAERLNSANKEADRVLHELRH